jgi:hypothetical protein
MDYLVYSDGSGGATAEASTNSVDVAAYTLRGSRCITEEEGLLFQEQGGCFPLATSNVCVLQEADSEPPSETPTLFPTQEETSVAPTVEESESPTPEVEISASPAQQLSSFFPSDFPTIPSFSLEPSFLMTKPPRVGCSDGDHDDDNGKGENLHGYRGDVDIACRQNVLNRKHLEKLFDGHESSKLRKSSKNEVFKSQKSQKSNKRDCTYVDNDDGVHDSQGRDIASLKGPPKVVKLP